jgi:hypothetical protein
MKKKLQKISKKLKKASKAHAGQAKQIDNIMKQAPFKMKGPGVKAADKISRKPASAGRKATTAASNVAKGFSSKAKSALSQLTKSAKNTFVNNAVSGVKQMLPKGIKGVARASRANPASALLGAAATAVYNQGQKRTGGKVRKGQKTNTMGFGKKSMFKK